MYSFSNKRDRTQLAVGVSKPYTYILGGDAADTEAAGKVLYSMTKNPYGFEGICLAENIDKFAGLNVTKEIPTLYQISVAVMKNNTKIVMR